MMSQPASRRGADGNRRSPVLEVRDNGCTIVRLQQRVLPCHTELLARWLAAGRRMGLCEAAAFRPERPGVLPFGPRHDYVLVWVRENSDPAYMVLPDGVQWTVVDMLRQQKLRSVGSFAAALDFIRPVLPVEAAA